MDENGYLDDFKANRPIYWALRDKSSIESYSAQAAFDEWLSKGELYNLKKVCAVFVRYQVEYPKPLRVELEKVGQAYLFGKVPKEVPEKVVQKRTAKRLIYLQMFNLIYYAHVTLKRASIIGAQMYNHLYCRPAVAGGYREKTAYAIRKAYTKEFDNTGEEAMYRVAYSEDEKRNEEGRMAGLENIEVWTKLEKSYPQLVGRLDDNRDGDAEAK